MMETPRERAVARREVEGDSISVVKGEYSIWTAEMGWMAWARRRVVEEISERPRYFILPSLCYTTLVRTFCVGLGEGDGVCYFFNCAIASTVFSIGVTPSTRWQ